MKEWDQLTLKEQTEYVQQVSMMIERGDVSEDVNTFALAKELYESNNYSMLIE